MMNGINKSPAPSSDNAGAIGLRTAVKIMERWGATQEQMKAALRVSRSTVTRAKSGSSDGIKLDSDQLDRVSYILNIHAALRVIFENPNNVYGFVSMANENEFFNGRKPLDVIADGSFAGLYETFRRIDGMRGGGW